MKILHKVTLAYLIKNKVRTTVTVIGIALSTALICAMSLSVHSFHSFLLANIEYYSGSYHGHIQNVSREQLDKIQNDPRVQEAVYDQSIGYALMAQDEQQNNIYLNIAEISDGFENMVPVHVTAGRLPESPDQLLLPETVLGGAISYKPGDSLTLEIGSLSGTDENLPQSQNAQLSVEMTRSFTISGFYNGSGVTNDYTAFIPQGSSAPGGSFADVYFKLHRPGDIKKLANEYNVYIDLNTDLMMLNGVSGYRGFYIMLYGLSAIVTALIMFGAVSLIFNAFSISISERTRQFGLLYSLGATRRQLRGAVIFEALAVSVVGIPAGIAVGVGGIYTTLVLLGDKFRSILSVPITMKPEISFSAIAIACAISLLTVLISAWLPSRRAMRISAIDAIRQTQDINIRAEKLKTSPAVQKLFGIPGYIAVKQFRRNRKRYMATILSLFMSIVLFISASALSTYLNAAMSDVYESEYQFDMLYSCSLSYSSDLPVEKLTGIIRSHQGVTNAAYSLRYYMNGKIPVGSLSPEYSDFIGKLGEYEDINLTVQFVQDDAYREFLVQNGLSEQEFTDTSKPVAVAIDTLAKINSSQGRYEISNVLKEPCTIYSKIVKNGENYIYTSPFIENGQEMYSIPGETDDSKKYMPVSELDTTEVNFEVGAVVREKPFFFDMKKENSITLIFPYSCRSKLIPEDYGNSNMNILISADNHAEVYESLSRKLTENGISHFPLFDFGSNKDRYDNMLIIIRVFSYGFIILISLIAAANVFNTISTNINLRRREFAMLKSIGMSSREFNRMLNFECLMYGAKALLYGLPVSAITTVLIYLFISSATTIDFIIPYGAVGVAVLSVFAVVFSAMLYSKRKIRNDNPVDALKNENM